MILKKDISLWRYPVNLFEAPFRQPLRVSTLSRLDKDVRLVLVQLGVDEDEWIEKMHVAPLGDPVSLRIGQQLFTLRKEICRQIDVELQ
ncbi:MAG: FeoA family protein [Bdellovibrionota bacterium]